jgi:site-specific recombinase XerD
VWPPRDLYTDARSYINQEDLTPDDHLLQSEKGGGLSASSARRVVRVVAERVLANTGRDKFASVSSHDLRRYYATRLLVAQGANPRGVMRLGGRSHFSAIEPYLHDPTDSSAVNELGGVNFP